MYPPDEGAKTQRQHSKYSNLSYKLQGGFLLRRGLFRGGREAGVDPFQGAPTAYRPPGLRAGLPRPAPNHLFGVEGAQLNNLLIPTTVRRIFLRIEILREEVKGLAVGRYGDFKNQAIAFFLPVLRRHADGKLEHGIYRTYRNVPERHGCVRRHVK